MDYLSKKVLIIDVAQRNYEFKSFTELTPYIGGVGIGLKLLTMFPEEDPVIFSVGPFNGFYPYASKTSIVVNADGVVEDFYIGGSMSLRIRYMGLDAIVIKNQSDEKILIDADAEKVVFRDVEEDVSILGLPGRRSVYRKEPSTFYLDEYFEAPENFLENALDKKNILGLVLTGTKTFQVKDRLRYEEIYRNILSRQGELTVEKSHNPSCSGCPMGCDFSKVGEIGGNVLIHSLVACQFAEKIYSDVGIVFSCLNALGYEYTHEDIETQPRLINDILKNI